jgi:hypothetical protein
LSPTPHLVYSGVLGRARQRIEPACPGAPEAGARPWKTRSEGALFLIEQDISLMAFLFYSTWLLSEQLRLWNELILQGCRWWSRSDQDPAELPSEIPDGGPAPPPDGPAQAMGRPPAAYFERLVATAKRITRHAAYPGKQQAVDHCVEDVEDLIASGRITADQGAILLEILSGACLQGT